MAHSAESLHAAAVDHVNAGRFAAARRALESAERRAETGDVTARILGTRAFLAAHRGDHRAAATLSARALDIPGLQPRTFAILAGQLGSIHEHAGRFDDAERWLSRGIAALGEPSMELGNLLVNRSLVNMQRRRLDAAARDAGRAAEIFERSGAPVDVAQARHNQGYVLLLSGDLVAALALMSEARPVFEALSPVAAAVSDADRAEVLRDAGLVSEAERLLARAAASYARERMPQPHADTQLQLARSQLTHDPPAARETAAAALRRYRRLGNEVAAARALAVRLRADLRRDAASASVRPARRTATARVAVNDVSATADALERFGCRTDAAALRLEFELWAARRGDASGRAMPRVGRSSAMEVRMLSHAVRAERASARGASATARRHAARGMNELSDWQRTAGSLDLQTGIAGHGDALLTVGLREAVRSGRPDTVFEWSERARHQAMQVAPLRPPHDDAAADALARLRLLRSERGDDWTSDGSAGELIERLRERQWSGTGVAGTAQRIELGDVATVLDADTAVISYVWTRRELVALVVKQAGATLVPLPGWPGAASVIPGLRADLDMAASVRHGPIADVVRRSLDERLSALSAALLEAPIAAAAARRLVLTAPGLLNGIPWTMLPDAGGRVLTLAPSVSRWVAAQRDTPPRSAARRVGFAAGPGVRRGADELASAARAWPAPEVIDHASVDAVTSLAARVDVLHLVAHGRHVADNPMFAGMELADGTLFGYDIDRVDPVPSLVVLSACEAGRSTVRWGEEAVGMTRIWLHAGAHCVVAAPVVVADDDACELLAEMHARLSSGAAAAEALAEASVATGIRAAFQTHGDGF